MFITGVGIGPTLSVFTIVVQNAVPFKQLGVATSNLTFFRQIGGSVGLAITGTIFGTRLVEELPGQLTAAGVPQQVVRPVLRRRHGRAGQPGRRGRRPRGADPGAGPGRPSATEPLIPAIVEGIHNAFTIGVTAQAFRLGVVCTILAAGAALIMQEIPLRTTNEAPVPSRYRLRRADRRPRPTQRPLPSRAARPRPTPDLRSSSRSTAPVVPTGAVVRPNGYDAVR